MCVCVRERESVRERDSVRVCVALTGELQKEKIKKEKKKRKEKKHKEDPCKGKPGSLGVGGVWVCLSVGPGRLSLQTPSGAFGMTA